MNDRERDDLLVRIDERVQALQKSQQDYYSLCSDHRDRCRAEVDAKLDGHAKQLAEVAGKILSWRTTALVLGAVVLTVGANNAQAVVAAIRAAIP